MTNAWSNDDGRIFISGTLFSSVTGSDFTAEVIEIGMAGGGRDVSQVRCMGSGTNSYMYRQGQQLIEASLKFHKKDNSVWLGLAGGSYSAGMPEQHTGDGLRYPARLTYEFVDRFDVSGAMFRCTFDNAYFTDYSWSMSNDGTMEAEATIKCLPHDYKEAYTSNRITSPLT